MPVNHFQFPSRLQLQRGSLLDPLMPLHNKLLDTLVDYNNNNNNNDDDDDDDNNFINVSKISSASGR